MKSDSRRGVKRGNSSLPSKPPSTISKKNRVGVQSSTQTQDSASPTRSPMADMPTEAHRVEMPTETPTEEELVDMPNRKRSNTWTNFKPVVNAKGLKKLECIHCGTLLVENRISSLSRHSLSCKKNRPNIQPTSDTVDPSNWQFSQVRLRKKIAEMIILDELPFGFVEKEGFNRVMQAACPMFNMPSKSTIKEDCLKLFLDEKDGQTTTSVVDDRTSADWGESSSEFEHCPPSHDKRPFDDKMAYDEPEGSGGP